MKLDEIYQDRSQKTSGKISQYYDVSDLRSDVEQKKLNVIGAGTEAVVFSRKGANNANTVTKLVRPTKEPWGNELPVSIQFLVDVNNEKRNGNPHFPHVYKITKIHDGPSLYKVVMEKLLPISTLSIHQLQLIMATTYKHDVDINQAEQECPAYGSGIRMFINIINEIHNSNVFMWCVKYTNDNFVRACAYLRETFTSDDMDMIEANFMVRMTPKGLFLVLSDPVQESWM